MSLKKKVELCIDAYSKLASDEANATMQHSAQSAIRVLRIDSPSTKIKLDDYAKALEILPGVAQTEIPDRTQIAEWLAKPLSQ